MGVLEFTEEQARAQPQNFDQVDGQGDSQMAEEGEGHFISGEQMWQTGVPDEACLPHLHVITYRKNYPVNTLAELPLKNISDNYVAEHQEELSGAYAKILAFLRLFLGGDRIAAEYLLLSLVSRIYRREGGLTIGALNINLNGVSPEQAALICEFVQAVNPLVCRFDATIQSLSEQRFMPAKNHDSNKMDEGYMGTLINNTVFMFDETRLEPGKLVNHGVPNIAAMATLVEM